MISLEFRPRRSYMYQDEYAYCSVCGTAFRREQLGRLICPFCGRPLRRKSRSNRRVKPKPEKPRIDPEKYGVDDP